LALRVTLWSWVFIQKQQSGFKTSRVTAIWTRAMADLPHGLATRSTSRRHPGLDPAFGFFFRLRQGSQTPGQARGDDCADGTAVLGAMDIVFGECDR